MKFNETELKEVERLMSRYPAGRQKSAFPGSLWRPDKAHWVRLKRRKAAHSPVPETSSDR